jgi:phage terminase large subunit
MNKIVIPYRPRPLQKDLHNTVSRFSVVVCHRRFGKTVWAINKIIKDVITAKKAEKPRPRGDYIAPLFKQAKKVAWDYAKFYCEGLPGYKANESELKIDFLGDCRITLYGADNPDSVRGIYSDSAVLDEVAQMNPTMWSEVIRPALSDRQGKASFIGTPKGKNVFWELYTAAKKGENTEWSAHTYKASETGYVDDGELLSAKNDMTEEEYAQEYECSWEAAIKGAYYGKLMEIATSEKRIRRVPWEPSILVNTAWDLGMDDLTAIWFYQMCDREIWLINFYENSGAGLDHYVKYMNNKEYTYGRHYLPHDINVKELGTGVSRLKTLRGLGVNGIVVPKIPVDDGINAARSILPRCYFDEQNCDRGIEALRQYRVDYDEMRQTPRQRPRHDWTSHGADAFRYLAVSLDERRDGKPRQTQAISDYDVTDPYGRNFNSRRPRQQTIAIGTMESDLWK